VLGEKNTDKEASEETLEGGIERKAEVKSLGRK
jgi:hypothetical protein